jgi:hypothetical protein
MLTLEYGGLVVDRYFSEKVAPELVIEAIATIKERFENGLDAPYGVDVVNTNGDRMTVGYDNREGFLMYQPGHERGEVQYSLGDSRRADTKVFYLPQWTELSGGYMVPTKEVLEALRAWASRGALSPNIEWTNEIF